MSIINPNIRKNIKGIVRTTDRNNVIIILTDQHINRNINNTDNEVRKAKTKTMSTVYQHQN